MRLALVARRIHKWLALFVGLQVLLWLLTGLYMTAIHIDVIHGDRFIRPPDRRPFDLSEIVEPSHVLAGAPGGRSVRLARRIDQPVYVVETGTRPIVFDAATGARLDRPNEATIRAVARDRFMGDAPIVSAVLLDRVPPEVRGRESPIWRVEFGGWNRPTLYLSAATGELLTRRHELWRVFDFAWMLHIMDYDERENVNNPLLRVTSWAAVLMATSGAWLLLYGFAGRKRTKVTR
jgi:uncharacterized iron-regulated membrane protein